MFIRVIHGPNLNMLGIREPEFYGSTSLVQINGAIHSMSDQLGVKVECLQSNHEGQIVSWIQEAVLNKNQQVDGCLLYTSPSPRD